MNDPVNHPKHYCSDPSGVEAITVTRHRSFCIGNAIKYLWRAGLKTQSMQMGGFKLTQVDLGAECEDLNKAIWYICDEIGRLGGKLTADHPLMALRDRKRAKEIADAYRATDRMDFEGVLLDAFGVSTFEEIQVKFLDHIPNAEVVIPLMRAVGGRWAEMLRTMEAFTKEQKAKLPGAGVGAEYVKEAEKAVERA